MDEDAEILVEGMSKRFGAVVAVEQLDFTVRRGEVVAIVGSTGAGKSTVLHALLGAIQVDTGRVRVAGYDPYHEHAKLRGRLGVAFQNDRLLPWRRAWENVALGLEVMGVDRAQRRATAEDWLRRVKMAGTEETYPHELSGGMRQRLSFARAMAVSPSVLLLDETFNQLDEVTSRALRADFLAVVSAMQTTCLFVTHRIDEALEAADRVLVFARPARIVHEVRTTAVQRADAGTIAALRAQIQRVMEQAQGPPVSAP